MSRRPIIAGIQSSAEATDDRSGELFREAMSRWASGVAVLAVRDEEEVVGLTVTTFTSLSMDPPLVLVSVGEQAAALPFLLDRERFTINILGESGRAAASRFSQQMPDDPSLFEAGDPVLRGAIASLVCELDAVHPGGDHRIVVGRVERVVIGPDDSPLLYHAREYRSLF
jgi:flavin reductase (NADH)